MKTTLLKLLPSAIISASALFITACTTPAEKGWHRPARSGERVGQIMDVKDRQVTVSLDETCLVHPGDLLSVKRLFCEPGAGRKNTKGCTVYESGTITISAVNVEDHTASGKITEGSAAADAPVFMTEQSLSAQLSTH